MVSHSHIFMDCSDVFHVMTYSAYPNFTDFLTIGKSIFAIVLYKSKIHGAMTLTVWIKSSMTEIILKQQKQEHTSLKTGEMFSEIVFNSCLCKANLDYFIVRYREFR